MPEIKVVKFPEGRYEGEVDENGVPHGEGEFEYPGNDDLERQVSHRVLDLAQFKSCHFQIYVGQFNQKKAHGRGLLRWREGDKGRITRSKSVQRQKSINAFEKVVIRFTTFTILLFLISPRKNANV